MSEANAYSQLHRLALRLLFSSEGWATLREHSRLLIGEMPEDLPVKIPLPKQSRVLGTLFRGGNNVDIVIDVDMSPKDILGFYEEELLNAGWSRPPSERSAGGFTSSGHLGVERTAFCFSPEGPMLGIAAGAMGETTSDLRLYIHIEAPDGQCDPESQRHQQHPQHPQWVIPSLQSPTGAWKSGGGGSRGHDEQSSSAKLETELSVEEALEHYADQLQRVGWKRLDTVLSQLAACANWTFQDDRGSTWIGLLTASKPDPQSDVGFVHITAYRI